jgi:putative hydrolase of HD superfamily
MYTAIVHRIFEAQHLKQIKHEWWRLVGVQYPDSVAEHSLVAAQIGRYLAVLEWADPHTVVTTLVFHDLPETRIGDLHRVATNYLHGKNAAEEKICNEQMADMPWGEQLRALFMAYETRADLVGNVAKDADYLEQAFQAKIYIEQGYQVAEQRITNVGKALKTASAVKLREELAQIHSTDRWQWLTKIPTN